MEYKKTTILFFFSSLSILIAFLASSVTAVTPSQMQVNFDISKGENVCERFSVSSGEATSAMIEDVWAEDYGSANLNKFTYDPKDHGIEIDYDPDLDFSESQTISVDICITANKVGKYQGALIFSPKNQTGNVLQYSTWLNVVVEEKESKQTTSKTPSGSGGGSSASTKQTTSQQKKAITSTSTEENTDESQEENTKENNKEKIRDVQALDEEEKEKSKEIEENPRLLITGSITGFIKRNPYLGFIFLPAILVALFVINKKRKQKE